MASGRSGWAMAMAILMVMGVLMAEAAAAQEPAEQKANPNVEASEDRAKPNVEASSGYGRGRGRPFFYGPLEQDLPDSQLGSSAAQPNGYYGGYGGYRGYGGYGGYGGYRGWPYGGYGGYGYGHRCHYGRCW